MIAAVVIIEAGHVKEHSDVRTTTHFTGTTYTIQANVNGIHWTRPAPNKANEMRVFIEVVPGYTARLIDRQEFAGEIVMTGEHMIDGGGRQAADVALNPDDPVHSQRKMRRIFVCHNTCQSGIPGAHSRIVVVIQTWLAESELDPLTSRDIKRERLLIEEMLRLCRGDDQVPHRIIVLPGHCSVKRDNQEKRHK